jgi:hypothetical protein
LLTRDPRSMGCFTSPGGEEAEKRHMRCFASPGGEEAEKRRLSLEAQPAAAWAQMAGEVGVRGTGGRWEANRCRDRRLRARWRRLQGKMEESRGGFCAWLLLPLTSALSLFFANRAPSRFNFLNQWGCRHFSLGVFWSLKWCMSSGWLHHQLKTNIVTNIVKILLQTFYIGCF